MDMSCVKRLREGTAKGNRKVAGTLHFSVQSLLTMLIESV
jgi:hypothetical protein